ncbi:MAG TPA: ribosome maturation factor RimM [Verrucomicrobiae bacterium]|nr:ribosome maturation factor RimM [Verrucomicrobiae bacterium]
MDRIIVGKILATQGIKGEVRVYPYTDNPERLCKLATVYLTREGAVRPVRVIGARRQKNIVVVRFQEITTVNEAESLRDWNIEIDKKDLRPLPEGKYYIFQLIGLKVRTCENEVLGVISEVMQTGANDVYVVKSESGKETLIPALKRVVMNVDLEAKEMVINPMPGLLD